MLNQQEKKLLDDKQKALVNLSVSQKNSQFGTVNLYDPTVSGESEIMLSVFQALNLPLDADMATNLLAGIETSTSNLSSANSADTYEAVATLLRQGAKKGHLNAPPAGGPRVQSPFGSFQTPTPQPFMPVTPVQPEPISMGGQADEGPSPDWLKPKVFKSGVLQ